ncbi:hypothetical protein [Halomicrobium urmianum]|uniref:hypothetical protein n=1 Tax=Halomicrobium urmianum TaxID=1586233 RepID=UPI001CD97326|nr:hypothetical protein [Halomicrobium urmianum]
MQITEDAETADTYRRTFSVDRGYLDQIFTGVSSFVTPADVDVRTVDVHGNDDHRTLQGPDGFGEVARTYDQLPIEASETGFVGLMSFSSGVTTVAGEAIFGIVEMLTNPVQYAQQMIQFTEMIANNPSIITKFPGMMAEQISQQHETRNPFDGGDEHYATFGGGWSFGYATGTVAPAAASGGGSVLQKGLSSSRKLQRLVDAADSAVPSRTPTALRPGVLRRAGKIDRRLPDVNVRTGTLSARLNDLPGPKRQQVVDQFDELDDGTRQYLGRSDVDAPASEAADLFRNAGPSGRRALREVSDVDEEAADILLEIDDANTQRRFVRALENGEVDETELASALRRYDTYDSDGQRFASDVIKQTGDDGPRLLSTDVCNSPCHGTVRAVYEYTDGYNGVTLSDREAKDLLQAYDEADDITDRPGANGPGTVQERLNELGTRNDGGERVDGVDRSMRSVSGDGSGYAEIAGETRIASDALD